MHTAVKCYSLVHLHLMSLNVSCITMHHLISFNRFVVFIYDFYIFIDKVFLARIESLVRLFLPIPNAIALSYGIAQLR